jgi:peptidoglycan/LPS O-acetylase OafA/YrhL
MGSHFEYVLPNVGLLAPIKELLICGWVGVDMFFALSGFLITGILLATKGALNYYSGFYARRVLRIFPIYYLTIGAMFALVPIVSGLAAIIPEPSQRGAYWVFLENWLVFKERSWPPNALGHFWSLAIEEQFYLIWPACVAFCAPRTLRSIILISAFAMILVRVGYYATNPPAVAFVLSGLTRFDALLLGSFGALLYATRRDWRAFRLGYSSLALLIALVVSAIAVPETISPFSIVRFTLLAIFASVFILLLAETDGERTTLQRIMTYPGLRTIGRYSYGMYVYHVPLHLLAGLIFYRYLPEGLRLNPFFAIAYFASLAAATFLVAKVSYEYFERPILNLKRYFTPQTLAAVK